MEIRELCDKDIFWYIREIRELFPTEGFEASKPI
jgi:hypothetical protein